MATVPTCEPTSLSEAFSALAFESNLIQGFGQKRFERIDNFIKSRVPIRKANPNEGLDPREHIEYHFTGNDDGYTAVQSLAPDVSKSVNVRTGGVCDPCDPEAININVNNVDNALCDPPTCTLQSGYNVYRGIQQVRACETEPICMYNLMRMKHLGPYFDGVRKSFPKEMNVAYVKNLESNVIDFSNSNATTRPTETFGVGAGFIPGPPTSSADFGTFEEHAQYLRANGWTGPVVYGISHSSLQNMLKNHKAASGYDLQSTAFSSSDMRLNAVEGSTFQVGDVVFKIMANPPRGYITQTGTSTHQFHRVDSRILQAGSGAGITAEYDINYQSAWITCPDGVQRQMVELSYVIHPDAFYIQPWGMMNIPGLNVDSRFNMEVRVVRGAHLDCNKDDNKFILRALHYYKFVPHDPRLAGALAHLYTPYQRFTHSPPECDIPAEVIEVNSDTLCPPLDNSCCAVEGGSDPASPRCVEPTEDDPNPTNVPGEIRTECVVTTVGGVTEVEICATRSAGCLNAASIDYTTADGTGADPAVQPTNYTTASGTLNWADGESGAKCLTVTGLANVTVDDLEFTVDWSNVIGAAAAADMCTQTSITIPAGA